MELEYRGYKCRFDENDETWGCNDLSMENFPSLKSLKSKIDKHVVSVRRIGNIPAIYLHSGWGGVELRPIKLTTIAEDKESSVWGVHEKKGRGSYVSKERQKYTCDNLAIDTPENRRIIKEAHDLYKAAEQAKKIYDEAFKAIPRITSEDLKTLAGENLDSEDAA